MMSPSFQMRMRPFVVTVRLQLMSQCMPVVLPPKLCKATLTGRWPGWRRSGGLRR